MEYKAPSNSGGNASLPETLNIRYYWQVLLERRWLFITAFISVFVLSLIYVTKAPRIYQAVATIQIDRETENVANIKDALSSDSREQDYLQTQYKNLQSRQLIEKVVTKLLLGQDPRYTKAVDKPRAVLNDITIAPIRLTRLVELKVEHTNKKMATNIANTLALTFVEQNRDNKLTEANGALMRMDKEVEQQRLRVAACDKALSDYRSDITNVSVEATENIIFQSLRLVNESLTVSQTRATVARRMSQEINDQIAKGIPKEDLSQMSTSTVVQNLKSQINSLVAQISELAKRLGREHPEMKAKREALASLKQALDRECDRLIAGIESDASIAEAQLDSVKGIKKEWEDRLLSLGAQRAKYEQLRGDSIVQKKLYEKVLESQTELVVIRNNKVNNMRVRDYAWEPDRPIKPHIPLTILLGIVGGFAVGMALSLFANYLDDSIKTQEDVEIHLRQNFLGYVNNIKTNSVIERDLQAHVQPQSTATESFRTIRAAVSLMPDSDKFRILVVTSTIPSEGKSLVASNMAIVTAQTGLKTLLVDADMRRPSVHKAFQLHSPKGLSSYLMGVSETLEDVTHDTDIPNLDVICAGAIPNNPSELAGSKRMRIFLQEALKRYDRVFLDCPPVSAVSDPLVIAAQADGAIFVTKFNKIRREHARKSLQRLEDAGVRILGVALNDIDFEGKDSYYYSYYYYQNRYYASHYKSKPTVKSDESKIEPADMA